MPTKILIVGLGNPGKKYEKARHNAGFLAIDAAQKNLKFSPWTLKKKHEALVSEGVLENGTEVMLAKPQTFMNLSGKSIISLKKTENIPDENFWCIYDDIDLPLGTIRLRTEGSAGTHNGMRSIISTLHTTRFPRIRIGIETREQREEQELHDFVLGIPAGEEKKYFLQICQEEVPTIIQIALQDGFEAAAAKAQKSLAKESSHQ